MNQPKWLKLDALAQYLKLGRTELYQMAQKEPCRLPSWESNGALI